MGYECNSLALIATWCKFHEDPLATEQRWYCKMCNTRCGTKWGLVLEMVLRGEVYLLRLHLPDHDIMDLKAMSVARVMPSRFPVIPPAHLGSRDYFVPTAYKGAYTIDRAWMTTMPPV